MEAAEHRTAPVVAVVVPTRGRAEYLAVALRSLTAQRSGHAHELLVVDDGPDAETAAVAAAHGVRCIATPDDGHGLNAARNAGVRATTAPLVAFVDDDVLVPPDWLDALVDGARIHSEAEAFGGPIRARFEGGELRGCGREEPPITTLDLGPADREAEMVWGANFALRRSAWERVGPFEERLRRGHGDEEEWLERLRADGGRIEYLAAAGLDHRRTAADARLWKLMRSEYRRGRGARASDRRRSRAPSTARELRVLVGCGWHTLRRACPQGLVMGAHSLGRMAETLSPLPALDPDEPRGHDLDLDRQSADAGAPQSPADAEERNRAAWRRALSAGADPADFLSGDAGHVSAPWRRLKRGAGELAADAADRLLLTERRLDRIADRQGPLRVGVIGVVRSDSLLAAALPQLRSSRHDVTIALGSLGRPDPALASLAVTERLDAGKFENLNRVIEAAGLDVGTLDWLIVTDDDLGLPPRFLDRFLAVCERVQLDVAQPAQTLRSHSAWKVTRRRAGALARETRFVEIGPLTAFRGRVAAELVPFPPLRFGWGLDLHWAAIAAQRGWRLGVVDATPVRHETGRVAETYDADDATAEAAHFLLNRPYMSAARAQETLRVHRRLR